MDLRSELLVSVKDWQKVILTDPMKAKEMVQWLGSEREKMWGNN